MKTLIIGARGMLGHELARAFIRHKPFLWDLDEIDITVREQVERKIGDLAPELIINAAAYTNVDACETNEALAIRVNGQAVGYLADVAARLGATLVHYSTDYVFDGNTPPLSPLYHGGDMGGYVEEDEPSPINAYGRSKLAGEQELSLRTKSEATAKDEVKQSPRTYSGQDYRRAEDEQTEQHIHRDDRIASLRPAGFARNDKWYLIRTAWLYGAHGKNFIDTMLALAQRVQPIKVVDDQFGSPTYAADLAQATRELVESGKPSGIYHRTNDGITSWYGFAKEIFEVFGYTVSLQGSHPSPWLQVATEAIPSKNQKIVDLRSCTTAEYPLPAKRPAYSILKSTKLPPLRTWQEALAAYRRDSLERH